MDAGAIKNVKPINFGLGSDGKRTADLHGWIKQNALELQRKHYEMDWCSCGVCTFVSRIGIGDIQPRWLTSNPGLECPKSFVLEFEPFCQIEFAIKKLNGGQFRGMDLDSARSIGARSPDCRRCSLSFPG